MSLCRNPVSGKVKDQQMASWVSTEKEGIMVLICYLPGVCFAPCSWPATPPCMTNFEKHLILWSSVRSSQGKCISIQHSTGWAHSEVWLSYRRTPGSMWNTERTVAVTFPSAHEERMKSDRITSRRNILRHRIWVSLLKRSNLSAGKITQSRREFQLRENDSPPNMTHSQLTSQIKSNVT